MFSRNVNFLKLQVSLIIRSGGGISIRAFVACSEK
jgi:hypothetical protein